MCSTTGFETGTGSIRTPKPSDAAKCGRCGAACPRSSTSSRVVPRWPVSAVTDGRQPADRSGSGMGTVTGQAESRSRRCPIRRRLPHPPLQSTTMPR